MNIKLLGDIAEISHGTALLADSMGFSLSDEGTPVTVLRCESGFSVNVTEAECTIAYNTPADFYRALVLVVDAISHGVALSLAETPAFDTLGIMLDVSRGAVIKLSRIKEIVRYIARMGYNCLMLYTEDVYEMKKYPYFGYMRGRYTADELREIDEYCTSFGIEAVPCIQTLGHLSYPLRWSEFADMKESDAVLYIGAEKTYELIDEMVKTMHECFKTDKIHIGMDEAHGVGLGRYLLEHGYRNRFELLSEHLNAVIEICRKYNYKPMMWSDMFFRLGSKINSYYDWDNKLPDNIESLIPEGVTQVYWDYYNHKEELYDIMFSEHKKMNRPIMFAGGVWIWSGPSVNNVQSVESTLPALRSCIKYGVRDVLVTLWGDEGSECDFLESLWGLQLFAEYSYRGERALDSLDEMFDKTTRLPSSAFKLFDIDDFGLPTYAPEKASFEDTEGHIVNTSKQLLYLNPISGAFDKNYEGIDLKSHYKSCLDAFDACTLPDEHHLLFATHRQLVKLLWLKSDISPRIKAAYDSKDMTALTGLRNELAALETEYSVFIDLRMALWCDGNKPFGYELVMKRLGAAREAVHFSYIRLNDYICGAVDLLPELETERLYYNSIERPYFLEYFSDNIMAP